MLAASRKAARRTVQQQVAKTGSMLIEATRERVPKAQAKSDWDGTRPAGWCSGFIHDGRSGFYEHQPGFLKARVRC